MVRKPGQPDLIPRPLQQAVHNPPYPITPTSEVPPAVDYGNRTYSQQLNPSSAHDVKTFEGVGPTKTEDDSDSSENEWDDSDDEDEKKPTPDDLPAPLKVGGGKLNPKPDVLPSSLRVGPPDGVPRKSQESVRSGESQAQGVDGSASPPPVALQSHNPYRRMKLSEQNPYAVASGPNPWQSTATPVNQPYSPPGQDPVELPVPSPVDAFAQLSLNDKSPKEQPAMPQQPPPPPPPPPTAAPEPATPVEPTSPPPRHDSNASSAWDPGMDVSSLDAFSSRNHGLPQDNIYEQGKAEQRSWQEQQAWEQEERLRREREAAAANEAAMKAEQERKAEEEWYKGEASANSAESQPPPPLIDLDPPELPPRRSTEQEQAPPKPPRPQIDVGKASNASPTRDVETPGTKLQRQRKEHYQIKHIRWYDEKVPGIRSSPILIQNANGPCPLLALVNALVLSTPAGLETALVETLRTREQVTLGLLLDAVFDELMSGRRGEAAQELPDVTELYSFLITLHTGMNVNPRFTKSDKAGDHGLGGFEDTKEMRLYSTFNIPLIHGWIPPANSREYAAFENSAKTYEDAQNIQFHEEELEAKLSSQGLDSEEQRLFEDLLCIKDYFRQWPTQLTDYGLGMIMSVLKPGEIAILFRNDHFSTLYKEPRSGQLLTLVTDAGYASHEEIVWETLVDVSGQGSELYSGDFRSVGNASGPGHLTQSAQPQPVRSLLDVGNDEGWTTVGNRNNRRSQPQHRSMNSNNTNNTSITQPAAGSPAVQATSPPPASTEQEDADLALALQLQEEEEERHRRELAARRQREDELSEQYISHDRPAGRNNNRRSSGQTPPAIPPRRSNLPPPRITTTEDEDAPPPTYEQAASGTPYVPPPGHPASPLAPANGAAWGTPGAGRGGNAAGASGSAYAQTAAANRMYGTSPSPNPGRNRRRTSSRPTTLIDQIPANNAGVVGANGGAGRGGRRTSGYAGPAAGGAGGSASTPVVGPGGYYGEEREKCVVM